MSRMEDRELEPVAPGQQLLDVLTARRINAWQAILRDLMRGKYLRAGKGLMIEQGADGAKIGMKGIGGDPVANDHPFRLYAGRDALGNAVVFVRPGTVDGEMAAIAGDPLTQVDPVPFLAAAAPGIHVVALELEFDPQAVEDYQDPPQYHIGNGGSVTAVAVVQYPEDDWPPAESLPEVNADTGARTTGTFYQRLGYYTSAMVEGELRVTMTNNDTVKTSLQSVFCPPAQFNLFRQ